MHKDNIKKNIKTIKNGIKEIHSLQHWVLPVTVFNALFKSAAPFINIYMSARIIDELIGPKNVNTLIHLVIITIILNLAVHLISSRT